MLPFRVRRFRARDGHEAVILLRRGGAPFFYPNVFATSDYRNAGKSPNTTAQMLRALGMAIMWAECNGRDLDLDLVQGPFLSVRDADELANFLGMSAAEQGARYKTTLHPAGQRRTNVLRLEAYRPHPDQFRNPAASRAAIAEVGARIRWVAKYVEWHLQRRLHATAGAGQPVEPLKSNAEVAIQRLRHLAPSATGFIDDDKALEAPDVDVIARIEEILRPNSDENPFTSDFVKVRNYLIWRLLLDTGGRRHEVHGAKAEHVNYSTRRFEIVKSKSIERTVAIRSKTAAAFDDYIMDYWTKLPQASQARREGFLFCDLEGRHLSLRAINRIFETARHCLENVPQKITPHTMRRFWNYLFSQQIDQAPANQRMSPAEESRYRMRIMGWSTDAQAKRYNRRHIIEAGDKISQAMLDRFDDLDHARSTRGD